MSSAQNNLIKIAAFVVVLALLYYMLCGSPADEQALTTKPKGEAKESGM